MSGASTPLAPYLEVEKAHVYCVLGFEPRRFRKPADWLGVSRHRLRRLLEVHEGPLPVVGVTALPPLRVAVADPTAPEMMRLSDAVRAVARLHGVSVEFVTGRRRGSAQLLCRRALDDASRFACSITATLPEACAGWVLPDAPMPTGLVTPPAPRSLPADTTATIGHAVLLAERLRDTTACGVVVDRIADALAPLPPGTGHERQKLDPVLKLAVDGALEHAAGDSEGAGRLLRVDARRVDRVSSGIAWAEA